MFLFTTTNARLDLTKPSTAITSLSLSLSLSLSSLSLSSLSLSQHTKPPALRYAFVEFAHSNSVVLALDLSTSGRARVSHQKVYIYRVGTQVKQLDAGRANKPTPAGGRGQQARQPRQARPRPARGGSVGGGRRGGGRGGRRR